MVNSSQMDTYFKKKYVVENITISALADKLSEKIGWLTYICSNVMKVENWNKINKHLIYFWWIVHIFLFPKQIYNVIWKSIILLFDIFFVSNLIELCRCYFQSNKDQSNFGIHVL